MTPSRCHRQPLPDFSGRTFGTKLLVEIARQAGKNSPVPDEKSLWKSDPPQSPPLRKRRCGALCADARRVPGLHVHVLAPLSWLCPEGRLGEPVGTPGVRGGNGTGRPPEGRICQTRTVWDKWPPHHDKRVPQVVSRSKK